MPRKTKWQPLLPIHPASSSSRLLALMPFGQLQAICSFRSIIPWQIRIMRALSIPARQAHEEQVHVQPCAGLWRDIRDRDREPGSSKELSADGSAVRALHASMAMSNGNATS